MKPKKYTEAELKEMALIPDGTYMFETMEVHDTDKFHKPMRDKEGNPMSKLKLKIWDKKGRERFVFTNLFGDGKMVFRTRHYADSVGLIDAYENEDFDTKETIGLTGWCHIITRKGGIKNAETGEKWDDSNDVKDFVKLAEQDAYLNQKDNPEEDLFDVDIPAM